MAQPKSQAQILTDYGMTGWQVQSSRPQTRTTRVYNRGTGGYDEVPENTGNTVWIVVGPDGKHDEIVVKTPTESPGRTQDIYEVQEGPKLQPAKPDEPKVTPSAIGDWERIDANGRPIAATDTTTKAVKMRDPKTNAQMDLPDVAAGAKATVVTGERGQKWSWDGTTLKELTPATAKDPQLVQGQGGAIYTWDGTTLSTLQPGKPEPTEGLERANIKNGYHVTEKFVGGEWTTVAYGDPAKPGDPVEGKTRPNVKEGHKVTETYSGGDWTITEVGERATPREPQTITTSTEQPYIVRTDAQGNTVNIPNPNYVAPTVKTGTEVASRIGQIQTLANAKKDELMKKVGQAGYTADQALADFNGWWGQNVEGQIPALRAAQEEAQFARGKEQAAMRTAAHTSALGAGTQRIAEFNAQAGPGFAGEFGKLLAASAAGKRPDQAGVDYTKMLTREPINAAQGTAEALKYIDPTAAQMAGGAQPTWMTMNPADALNRTTLWGTQGAAGPPALPGTPAPVTAEAGASKNPNYVPPLPPGAAGVPGQDPRLSGSQQPPSQVTTQSGDTARYDAQGNLTGIDYINTAPPGYEEMMAAQQAEFEARQQADLEAMMASPAAATAAIPPYRQPVRRAPTPVSRAPFNQQALAAGLGGGGLGPGGPAPVAPAYWPVPDETYPGPNPFQGNYVPPNYLYGGQYATPTPY